MLPNVIKQPSAFEMPSHFFLPRPCLFDQLSGPPQALRGLRAKMHPPGFLEKNQGHLIVLTMPEDNGKADLLLRTIAKAVDFIIIVVLIKTIPRVGYMAGIIYLLISDGLFDGRSLGKKILRLQVMSLLTGNAGTFKDSILRNSILALALLLFKIPFIGWSFLIVVLLLEFLLILGSKNGMRLGDDMANTKVVEG